MKPNEETHIDEVTLTSVLNEHATDLKEIKNFIKEQQQQIDQKNALIAEKEKETHKLIGSFEQKYQKIEVTVPAPSTSAISKIASDGMAAMRTAVIQVVNAAFSKNRILVLPEDGGKGFLKTMAKRGMYLTAIAIVVGLVSGFGFHNWYKDSQNSRFRKAWYWNYLVADSTKKQKLQSQLDSLNISAINKYRTDSIERYLDIQATEIRIKQLEREADSLKTLRRKP
ncbi:hypothetical protein [Mucilaginibacter polytrichastri]|uniref:Uncharacterized protein n=1 Tax=Mucilaginibacter polytrichastri TaxID=1302689 RepID=A0A1Q5ZVZ0_9SPHI|nr:hypothetical protein [Mucilaginibacter polytrichastri]OKS85903.1 hypothetical protein RG47T_1349 [Mucilaginibacter polytrichastri]SFS60683.1 hypothetical protein SAMN04487890_102232 [Mucilaginibacter polytrichastri]